MCLAGGGILRLPGSAITWLLLVPVSDKKDLNVGTAVPRLLAHVLLVGIKLLGSAARLLDSWQATLGLRGDSC